MKKLVVGLLLINLFFLSSCVTLDISTEINENDTTINRYTIAVKSSIYTPGMYDELKKRAIDVGATIEDYSHEDRKGVIITETFETFDELMATFPTYDIDSTPSFFRYKVHKASTLLKKNTLLKFK